MSDAIAERLHRRTMRRLISALAALAVAGGIAAGFGSAPVAAATLSAHAATTAAAPALAAIRRFTSTLDATQRAALAGPTGTGVRLADLSTGQRGAALAVLDALLTPDARSLLGEAMAADDALAATGEGEGSGAYTIGFLEDPDGDGAFFQFAGPQLAVNAVMRDGELVVEPELIQA